jgi:D-alanine transaminase
MQQCNHGTTGGIDVGLTAYFNGEYVPREEALVPMEERAVNFADSLYEVCRVYGGNPFTLDRHIARLERGARIVELNLPLGYEDFDSIVRRLVELNEAAEGYTYIQVSRGNAPRGHAFPKQQHPNIYILVKPFEAKTLPERYAGVTVSLEPDLRHSYCDVKTTGLLPNVLALEAARKKGHFEALLVRGRYVTEGSNTSAWIVTGGVIRTHPLGNILPGITRSVLLDIAEEQSLALREEPFTPEELLAADEAFITGSTLEIVPVVAVEGHQLGQGKAGPVTRQLIQHYIERVERDCGQYWA